MKKIKWVVIFTISVICILIGIVMFNRFRISFEELNEIDKKMLTEMDMYCKKEIESELWPGYKLSDKTIFAYDGIFGSAYIINPSSEIKSMFATKIILPEECNLNVYRLAKFTLQVFIKRLMPGSFNVIGEKIKIFGNEVYYIKYDESNFEKEFSSKHFMPFLVHEAFHYFMQNEWSGGSRFYGELTESDISLIEKEYVILENIRIELKKEKPSRDELLNYSNELIVVREERIKNNPEYLEKELSMETDEGTAEYVGIKAAEIVGYNYNVMYFDSGKDIPFDGVIPVLKAGALEKSFLADSMPYETGALLCLLLEELEIPNWQEKLNEQTETTPVFLYEILQENI